ncbi:succinate-semialdehyde dehydrogenase (NADP(+)) [Calidifontibacter sp. DB0510]|uniref:succinate-semialdehyde dehydrogenase (NADP(+)) n=1 Tax=Metallococcus carri TaxID=1656884 RepID=A0A967B8B7_9MICO|nr:succinic semialdehyde dehydrogenase [Metallococcus carri]NHN56636.1 succinate-semialdehyde dehydrogenase (NADP(+)) [Metallococcus carri]NOP38935.1 succinate-semialdehyde dehydrogenase (NADP(+)) [Calidifontibacter sp. DB2511S]
MTQAVSSPPRTSSSRYAVPPGLAARLARRVVASPSAPTQECITPMDGSVLATLPTSTVENVEVAYRAARTAQQRWARTPLRTRSAVLLRLHDLVLQHQDELLDLIQLESGKARRHAFDEVLDTAGVCRHYARKASSYLKPRRHLGAIPVLSQSRELHHPKGVVGIVGPWNYPLSMSITDAIPALLAGNAVVLRPDQKAALTALRAVELFDEAGLPEGLLQVVLGSGSTVGQAVLDRGDYVMFTGSTKTGRTVAARAAERLVGASLELGGKNPMYVADDADIDRAAECAVRSCFSSAGQLCISIERLYVHEKIADKFTAAFVERVQQMRIGTALDWGYDMGSLISPEQLERVEAHVEDARIKGAQVLTGGKARPDIGPWVYEPTVLAGVTEGMACFGDETFGPVVAVHPVSSDAEAIQLANASPYGLNASVWTGDLRRGRRLGEAIHAGTVNVNEGYAAAWASNGSPMGGMGDSGLGRRHGAEGILKYTESQNVTVQHLMGFEVRKPLTEKSWAKLMTTSMRAMKMGRLS